MAQAIGNFTSYTAPQQGIYDPLAVGIGGFMGGTQYAADRKAVEQERTFAEEKRNRERADALSEDQYNEQMRAVADREVAIKERIAKQRATAGAQASAAQAIMAPPTVPAVPAPAPLTRGGGMLLSHQNSPGETPVANPQAAVDRAMAPVAALGELANKPAGAAPAPMARGQAPLQPGAPAAAPTAPLSPFDPELMREMVNVEYDRATIAERTKSTKFGEEGRAARARAEGMFRDYLDTGVTGARNALSLGSPDAFTKWKQAYPDLAAAAGVDDWDLLKVETTTVDGFKAPAYVFAEKGNPLPPVSGAQAEALIGSIAQDPKVFDKHIARIRETLADSVDRQHKATTELHAAKQLRQEDSRQATQQEQFKAELAAKAAQWRASEAATQKRWEMEMLSTYGKADAETAKAARALSTDIAKNGAGKVDAALTGTYKSDSNGLLVPGAANSGFGAMKVTINGQTLPVSTVFGADSRIDKSAVVGPALAFMRFSALNGGPGHEMGYDEAARLGVYAGTLQELSRQKGVNARLQLPDGRIAELRNSPGGVMLRTYRVRQSDVPSATGAPVLDFDAEYPTDMGAYSSWLNTQRGATTGSAATKPPQPQGAIR